MLPVRDIKPTVLVTGATGFVGQHLVNFLLTNQYRVCVYSRREFTTKEFPGIAPDDWFTGEIQEKRKLVNACSNADAIVHLANIAHVGLSDSFDSYRFNVESTRLVCEACLEGGAKQLVFLSSTLAEHPMRSAYGRSKRLAEDIVTGFGEQNSSRLQTTILRPANVYGPRMKGNIIALIHWIYHGRLPPLPFLSNQLSMVSVHDVCRAILVLLDRSKRLNRIYTLTDQEVYTPLRIEAAIYKAVCRHPPTWRTPRMVFFAAALLAEGLNRLKLWGNALGLRTYRNLVTDSFVKCRLLEEDFAFKPSLRFEDELPSIISSEPTITTKGIR